MPNRTNMTFAWLQHVGRRAQFIPEVAGQYDAHGNHIRNLERHCATCECVAHRWWRDTNDLRQMQPKLFVPSGRPSHVRRFRAEHEQVPQMGAALCAPTVSFLLLYCFLRILS